METETEETVDFFTEDARVFRYRMVCFLKLGFGVTDAEVLSLSKVDHHDARTLLSKGCTPDLAARILL